MSSCWHRKGEKILIERFEYAVVFDPQTGETHFLSELPMMLLAVVCPQPQDIRKLSESLDSGVDLTSELKVRMLQALQQLEYVELIESSLRPKQ